MLKRIKHKFWLNSNGVFSLKIWKTEKNNGLEETQSNHQIISFFLKFQSFFCLNFNFTSILNLEFNKIKWPEKWIAKIGLSNKITNLFSFLFSRSSRTHINVSCVLSNINIFKKNGGGEFRPLNVSCDCYVIWSKWIRLEL